MWDVTGMFEDGEEILGEGNAGTGEGNAGTGEGNAGTGVDQAAPSDATQPRQEDEGEGGTVPGSQSRVGWEYVEPFPEDAKAGKTYGRATLDFQAIKTELDEKQQPYGPFADMDEFELAEWLMENTGQTQTDRFLKLSIVSRLSLLRLS
jgi:hypothetical protein